MFFCFSVEVSLSHVQVFLCKISLVCCLKSPYNWFYSNFLFLIIFIQLMLVWSVLFLVAVIDLPPCIFMKSSIFQLLRRSSFRLNRPRFSECDVSIIVSGSCCLNSLFIFLCISNISRPKNQPFFMIILTSASLWLVWNQAHSSHIYIILFLYPHFVGVASKIVLKCKFVVFHSPFFMLLSSVWLVT